MTEALAAAFYVREGDLYRATAHTRGPWSPHHQHGGPPSALLARAIEEHVASESMRIARFTVVFHKPIGIDRFRIAVETAREGKKVRIDRAVLLAAKDDKVVASAEALSVRRDPSVVSATVLEPPRAPSECEPYEFSFFGEGTGYHTAMEGRRIEGTWGSGRMAMWLRMRVPVLAGEAPSPVQRVVCVADSGNGVSVGLDLSRYTFVNPDLTIVLGREPEGEWIGLDAVTSRGEDAIGLADSRLFDERGAFGRGLQSLIVERR